MTNSQRLAAVRKHLIYWINQQIGEPETGESPILSESILIREGHFCGRSFKTSGFRAIWFIEEDQLKVYEVDTGAIAVVFQGDEIGSTAVDEFSETATPAIVKLGIAAEAQPNDSTRDAPPVSEPIRRAA